jgi:hypothetical protein
MVENHHNKVTSHIKCQKLSHLAENVYGILPFKVISSSCDLIFFIPKLIMRVKAQ